MQSQPLSSRSGGFTTFIRSHSNQFHKHHHNLHVLSSQMALKSHLNTLYQIFFFIHIPLILLVDISPLYPPAYRPAFMDSIRLWYVATYKDRFFTDQSPSWFRMFIWMEAVLHLPVSVWALRGLAQGRREGRGRGGSLFFRLLLRLV